MADQPLCEPPYVSYMNSNLMYSIIAIISTMCECSKKDAIDGIEVNLCHVQLVSSVFHEE